MSWLEMRLAAKRFAQAGSPGAYLLAGATVVVAYMLRLALMPWLVGAQFITFFPAVIIATYFFGTGAGVFSLALSVVAAWRLLGGGGFSFEEGNSLALFAVVAAMDVTILTALRASTRRARRLDAELSESEEKFRHLLETAPDAMVVVDRRGRIALINSETEALFGFDAEELVGEPIERLVPVRFRKRHAGLVAGFLAETGVGPRRMGAGRVLLGLRKSGAEFPIEVSLSMRRKGDGDFTSASIRDISDRVAADQHLKLIAQEVDHRANNLLAVVQSIVTLSKGDSPDELRRNVLGRIDALGRTHQLLSKSRWLHAGLKQLIEEELRPYALGDDERVRLCGPDMDLDPAEAQALAMAFHELATNAAKYGALSAPGGRVEVNWNRNTEGARFIEWAENGGPPVTAPSRKGLGTTVLERSLRGPVVGGRTQLDWRPSGLVCTFELPPEGGKARTARPLFAVSQDSAA